MAVDELARFRTEDLATVAEAIARCDQADQIVRIAFHHAEDRRYVLRCAADAAKTFRTGVTEFLWQVSPWPDRLEVIELWAGGHDGDTPMKDRMRARVIATMVATAVVVLVLVLGRVFGSGGTFGLSQGLVMLLGVVLAPVVARLWGWAMKRQVRYLDELGALEHVTRRLVTFSRRSPARTGFAVFLLHRAYSDLLPRDGNPDVFQWPEIYPRPLDRKRYWAAAFDSYDPARDVCYYRIQIFRRRKLETQFMAEMKADFETVAYHDRVYRVRNRLKVLALGGQTNTTFAGPIRAAS